MIKKTAFFALILFLVAVPVTLAQAMPEDCNAIYRRYLDNWKGPEVEKMQTAVAAAKEYLSKCSEMSEGAAIREYFNTNLPTLEKNVAYLLDRRQFDEAFKAKDYEKAFPIGQRIFERFPNNDDLLLTMMNIGYQATNGKPRSSMADDTIRLAKMSLEKLDAGTMKSADDFAAYKVAACTDGQINARGWAAYIVGDLTCNALGDKKGALPYFYRATQRGCQTKNEAAPYLNIAAAYTDEYARLSADYQSKLKANNGRPTADTDKIYALLRGYADRLIDAYGRAYNRMGDTPKHVEVMNNLRPLYVFFFGKEDGLDTWLKSLNSTPFPDPKTEVKPRPLDAAK